MKLATTFFLIVYIKYSCGVPIFWFLRPTTTSAASTNTASSAATNSSTSNTTSLTNANTGNSYSVPLGFSQSGASVSASNVEEFAQVVSNISVGFNRSRRSLPEDIESVVLQSLLNSNNLNAVNTDGLRTFNLDSSCLSINSSDANSGINSLINTIFNCVNNQSRLITTLQPKFRSIIDNIQRMTLEERYGINLCRENYSNNINDPLNIGFNSCVIRSILNTLRQNVVSNISYRIFFDSISSNFLQCGLSAITTQAYEAAQAISSCFASTSTTTTTVSSI